jgi:hypothetical protein
MQHSVNRRRGILVFDQLQVIRQPVPESSRRQCNPPGQWQANLRNLRYDHRKRQPRQPRRFVRA